MSTATVNEAPLATAADVEALREEVRALRQQVALLEQRLGVSHQEALARLQARYASMPDEERQLYEEAVAEVRAMYRQDVTDG